MIEETLKVKLERGLPMTEAEFSRLARQLYNMMNALEKELNEIKVSGVRRKDSIHSSTVKKPVLASQTLT